MDDYYEITVARIPVGRPSADPRYCCVVIRGPIDAQAVQREHEAGDGESCPIVMSVTDNGLHGDGIIVTLQEAQAQEDTEPLLWMSIPDASAETIRDFLDVALRRKASQKRRWDKVQQRRREARAYREARGP